MKLIIKNYKKLWFFIENNFIDSDGGMYLTVESLIEANNILSGPSNFTLRKVNVKPYRVNVKP